MSRPRLLIAEDEAPQRDALRALLAQQWPEAEVVAICADGLAALEAAEAHAPDVAFLDIRMPGLSGLEVGRALAGRVHVVFVTAYDEHAVSAFETGAVDYLLKPVREERLGETVRRLRARLAAAAPAPAVPEALVAGLLAELGTRRRGDALKWITASLGDTVKLYPIEEVLAFQAQDKYTRVITAQEDAIIRKSLRELLDVLDAEDFLQVHRSAIVRATAIDRIERDELGKHWLTLKQRPGEPLPVASAVYARLRGM